MDNLNKIEFELPPCPIGRLLLVNVGDQERPATAEDIDEIVLLITKAKKIMETEGRATIVTHHLVKMTVIDL